MNPHYVQQICINKRILHSFNHFYSVKKHYRFIPAIGINDIYFSKIYNIHTPGSQFAGQTAPQRCLKDDVLITNSPQEVKKALFILCSDLFHLSLQINSGTNYANKLRTTIRL